MKRVEVYMKGPEGWAGWRRPVVVHEGPTEVILMQTATLRRLKMSRSAFEALRPRPITRNAAFVREEIAQAVAVLPSYKSKGRIRAVEAARAMAKYVFARINGGRRPMGMSDL